MRGAKIIVPECGGNLEIRNAGAVVLPTAPQKDIRTAGEGGYKARTGIVSYTGCIDHTPMYLAGEFCLYHIDLVVNHLTPNLI